jgi:hypothetical protein
MDAGTPIARRSSRSRFGWKELLFLAVMLPLVCGFFIWWYPFSRLVLPYALVLLAIVLGVIGLTGASPSLDRVLLWWFPGYVIVTVLGWGYIEPSGPWQRSACSSNLHQIALALLNYEHKYGSFPPAYIADANGRPMHSWRVLILPFMDLKEVYDQYRFDEPWDGPNNQKLMTTVLPVYHCPAQGPSATAMTSYVAVVGPATVWPGTASTKLADIRDGTSNTVLVVEMADSGIHWMEPRDLDMSAMAMSVNPTDGVGISSHHRAITWDRRLLGATVVTADNLVRFLPTDTPEERLRAMLTIAGGEAVEREDRRAAAD